MTNLNYMGFTFNEIMEMDELTRDIFNKHKMGVNINLKNNSVNIKNLDKNKKLEQLDELFIRTYFELLYGTKTKINVIN